MNIFAEMLEIARGFCVALMIGAVVAGPTVSAWLMLDGAFRGSWTEMGVGLTIGATAALTLVCTYWLRFIVRT